MNYILKNQFVSRIIVGFFLLLFFSTLNFEVRQGAYSLSSGKLLYAQALDMNGPLMTDLDVVRFPQQNKAKITIKIKSPGDKRLKDETTFSRMVPVLNKDFIQSKDFCGDLFCGIGEENSCPSDCDLSETCGNGVQEGWEDCDNCPQDAQNCCGNGQCNTDESCSTCAQDCCATSCGNGICEPQFGEDNGGCCADCSGATECSTTHTQYQ